MVRGLCSCVMGKKGAYCNTQSPCFAHLMPRLTSSWTLALTDTHDLANSPRETGRKNWTYEEDVSLTQPRLFTKYTQKLLFLWKKLWEKAICPFKNSSLPLSKGFGRRSFSLLTSFQDYLILFLLSPTALPPSAQHPGPYLCYEKMLWPAWIQAVWLPLKPNSLGVSLSLSSSIFIRKPFLLCNTSDM